MIGIPVGPPWRFAGGSAIAVYNTPRSNCILMQWSGRVCKPFLKATEFRNCEKSFMLRLLAVLKLASDPRDQKREESGNEVVATSLVLVWHNSTGNQPVDWERLLAEAFSKRLLRAP